MVEKNMHEDEGVPEPGAGVPSEPTAAGSSADATVYTGGLPDEGYVWLVSGPPPGSVLKIGDVLNVPVSQDLSSTRCHIRVAGEEVKVLCEYVDVTEREEWAKRVMNKLRHLQASDDLEIPGVGDDRRRGAARRGPW